MGEIKFKTGSTWNGTTFTGRAVTIEEARQKVATLAEAIKALDTKTKISTMYRERLI